MKRRRVEARAAALSLGGICAICLDDLAIRSFRPSYVVLALLDEPAHLMTALLVLEALRSLSNASHNRNFFLAALASSVLLDTDHIPSAWFGWQAITTGTVRPYSHSLITVALFAAAAGVMSGRARSLSAGIACGTCLHLLRDLATGGVALGWPITRANVTLPYAAYVLALGGAACVRIVTASAAESADTEAADPEADLRTTP